MMPLCWQWCSASCLCISLEWMLWLLGMTAAHQYSWGVRVLSRSPAGDLSLYCTHVTRTS